MSEVGRSRRFRYAREERSDSNPDEQGSYVICPQSSVVSSIREMKKYFPDSAIAQDLIDLGLEQYLPYV